MVKKKIFLVLLFAIFLIRIVSAANVTSADAFNAIKNSEGLIKELSDNGFNTNRVADDLTQAKTLYEAQKLLEERKKTSDYTSVLFYTKDIETVKDKAYQAKDQVFNLEQEYSALKQKADANNLDISSITASMNQIRQDMTDERYEIVLQNIPDLERTIIDTDAGMTTLNVFYNSVSKGVKQFFIDNYLTLLITLLVIVILGIFYKLKFYKYILKYKLNKLETEKSVLKGLIAKSQKEYFNEGKIAESTYHARITRYSEMVRDIERQIPLIKEELVKRGGLKLINKV